MQFINGLRKMTGSMGRDPWFTVPFVIGLLCVSCLYLINGHYLVAWCGFGTAISYAARNFPVSLKNPDNRRVYFSRKKTDIHVKKRSKSS